MAATIVHDTSEAVELFAPQGLFLKPIAKLTLSVSLPQLKQPGKSISNWEVMERLKYMVHPEQFATLRVSKSTMDFVRFEGEVENKNMVKAFLSKLDAKTIKLSGFTDTLKVRAAEVKIDFPTRHDWDSFFRDAKDINETLPGERPDTIHLEGLPCKWFALKNSSSEKPSDFILRKVFETFGEIRNVDIPMLDPYREEMTGKNFHTFSFGGHLNFEAYVQYQEYIGFVKAMDALRGMKLLYKGDDAKAVACSIKVTFDTTKHLSDASIRRRQLERQKLQELELQREEQKRREKEEEERKKEEERKQKELDEQEREKKREEKVRKREQKQKEREERRNMRKLQREEQKRLQEKIALEERKLLLAQRNLQSIRLIAELLSRAKVGKQQELEAREAEAARLHQMEEKRRQQEAELKRVEEEKERVVELQQKEKELREKLLENLKRKEEGESQQSRAEPNLCPRDQVAVNAIVSVCPALGTTTVSAAPAATSQLACTGALAHGKKVSLSQDINGKPDAPERSSSDLDQMQGQRDINNAAVQSACKSAQDEQHVTVLSKSQGCSLQECSSKKGKYQNGPSHEGKELQTNPVKVESNQIQKDLKRAHKSRKSSTSSERSRNWRDSSSDGSCHQREWSRHQGRSRKDSVRHGRDSSREQSRNWRDSSNELSRSRRDMSRERKRHQRNVSKELVRVQKGSSRERSSQRNLSKERSQRRGVSGERNRHRKSSSRERSRHRRDSSRERSHYRDSNKGHSRHRR
ncbi:A-kinase anchor protein 17A-like [Carcharodon carcharias]|uniref:A-kinase anchor protein 17A-like n=1 Tax=Carcharodon carcharias TaxID=13397 RepID=UPI001B7F2691|nr:A-kinase anchor protein 17A-like [Carcharodon carcharias]XP_041055016.1 A-kinase anchor protein 17A-like [Carcharodon carcharias]